MKFSCTVTFVVLIFWVFASDAYCFSVVDNAITGGDNADIGAKTHGVNEFGFGVSEDSYLLNREWTYIPFGENKDSEIIYKIQSLYKEEKIKDAIQLLEIAIEKNPSFLSAKHLLVLSYIKDGNFTKAGLLTNELLRENPKEPRLYYYLGVIEAADKKNYDEAEKLFKKSIYLDSKAVDSYAALAKIQAIRLNYAASLDSLNKLINIDTTLAPAYFDAAILSHKLKNDDDAERYLNKFVTASNNSVPSVVAASKARLEWYIAKQDRRKLSELGRALGSQYLGQADVIKISAQAYIGANETERALQILRSEISSAPDDLDSRILMSRILYLEKKSNEVPELNKILDELEKLALRSSLNFQMISGFFVEHMLLDRAEKIIEKSKSQFQDSFVIPMAQGDVHIRKGNLDSALESYKIVYKTNPTKVILFYITNLMSRLNKLEEAISLLNEEAAKSPDNSAIQYELGGLYLKKGDYDLARKCYLDILSRDPNNVFALNNVAFIYLQENNGNKAISYAERAHKVAPNTSFVTDTYGEALVRMGRVQDAIRNFKFAAKADPDNPTIQFHLAKALVLAGENKNARSILDGLANSTKDFPEKGQVKQLIFNLR